MSSLVILNASAGSGKTYQIARQFLKLTMKRPQVWQRILAVTFTNKAAAEMRVRILSELRMLSLNPAESKHLAELMRYTKLSEEELQQRASAMLPEILFRLDRLQVLTLDSFFQLLLRSHARELGLPGGYELQIDTREATQEVVSNLLTALLPGSPTSMWLSRFIEERVGEGKNWNVRGALEGLAQTLFDESFQHWRVGSGNSERLSEQAVQEVILRLETERNALWQEVRGAAEQCFVSVQEKGWDADKDFKKGGWTVVRNWVQTRSMHWFEPGITSRKFYEGAEEWFTKSSELREEGIPWVGQEMLPHFRMFLDLIDAHRNRFVTLDAALGKSHELGLMESLLSQMADFRREHNTLLLADAGPILRQVTEGNPLSFIYEKLGSYFNHFMIDEFQDTSRLQWENFRPFIEQGISEGYTSFLVGDVKQSIYRFRNGDWRLLAYEVAGEFANEAEVIPLTENWRSTRNVIDFNNALFLQLAGRAPGFIRAEELPEGMEEKLRAELQRITEAYADVSQTEGEKRANPGYVTCSLVPGDNKAEIQEAAFKDAAELIRDGLARGYRQSDIAILARTNGRLAEFGAYLEELRRDDYFYGNQVKLLSDGQYDPLHHPALRILVGALEYLREDPDPVRLAEAAWIYQMELGGAGNAMPGNEAEKDGNGLFERLAPYREIYGLESVYHLCHRLVRNLKLDSLEDAGGYLRSFLNLALEQGGRGKSGLERFLHFWRSDARSFQPVMNDAEEGLVGMTFHKSKGLQFPLVIVLLADWAMTELHRESQWLPFRYSEDQPALLVNVTLSSSLMQSDFSANYVKAYCDQVLENLNLLYVACTRAETELHILIPGSERGSLSIHRALQASLPLLNLEGLVEADARWSLGSPQRYKRITKENGIRHTAERNFPKKSLAELVRFQAPRAYEAGVQAMEDGRLFHRIMERVGNKETDLQHAITYAKSQGWIEGEQDFQVWKTWVHACLNSEGFRLSLGENVRILNEVTLLHPKLGQRRPDRVFLHPEFIGVIDFKTGVPRAKDEAQLREYMGVLSEMQGASVRAWLLYPSHNQEIEVK